MKNSLKINGKLKFITMLTGITAAALYLYNKMEFSHAIFQNILSSPENKDLIYNWRFGKIRYTKTGSGSPLLLLHDLTPGSSSYEYSKVISGLSNTHEVYCLDLIGFGKSEKPEITYTNYLYVQLITDFIKNVISRKTDIIASGGSVPVAIMACHNDNDIIQRIIAINPQDLYQLSQIPSRKSRLQKLILNLPIVGTFIYNLYTNKNSFTRLFSENYFYDAGKIEEADISAYVEASHIGGYHAKYSYSSYIGRYMNINIIHALKEINNSIIIIAADGKENNHTIMDNYVYYNPSIESVFVARSRQLLLLERPNMVLKHLKTFL